MQMNRDQTYLNMEHQDQAKKSPTKETGVNLPRRTILRGVLAFGCSLCLPIAFSGCEKKKSTESTSPAPESPPASSTSPAAPAAPTKMAQASVQYQAQPKDGLKCSGCMYFEPATNTCKVVEGQISPDGWCMLWSKIA